MALRQRADRGAQALEPAPEALATMPGYQHALLPGLPIAPDRGVDRARAGLARRRFAHRQQRVDDGVAGDEDAVRRRAFGQQIVARSRRRREMEPREPADQDAVRLLRERGRKIAGAKPCLDMADGNARIEGGE